jgi:hypothetical protein
MTFCLKNSAIEFTTYDCASLKVFRVNGQRRALASGLLCFWEGAELVINIIKTFFLVQAERIVDRRFNLAPP